MDFDKKISWSHREKGYTIEIAVWRSQGLPNIGVPAENHWALYAYIYNTHKLFQTLPESEDIFDCPIEFHGGCTFAKMIRGKDGEIRTKQFGCDYSHYGDKYFMEHTNMEVIPPEITSDALVLMNWLNNE